MINDRGGCDSLASTRRPLNQAKRLLKNALNGIHLGVIDLGKTRSGEALRHLRAENLRFEFMTEEFMVLDVVFSDVWEVKRERTHNISTDTFFVDGKCLHGQLHPIEAGRLPNEVPSDVQSLRSQATYSSGIPMFAATGPFGAAMPCGANGGKHSAYGSSASSIISQDTGPSGSVTDNSSVIGASERATSSMAYSQSDRLRRRASFSSSSVAGASDLGSISQYDYKSQDDAADMDDMKSQYAGTQSGVTVF